MFYGSELRVAGISTYVVTFSDDGNVVLTRSFDNVNDEVGIIVLRYENQTFI